MGKEPQTRLPIEARAYSNWNSFRVHHTGQPQLSAKQTCRHPGTRDPVRGLSASPASPLKLYTRSISTLPSLTLQYGIPLMPSTFICLFLEGSPVWVTYITSYLFIYLQDWAGCSTGGTTVDIKSSFFSYADLACYIGNHLASALSISMFSSHWQFFQHWKTQTIYPDPRVVWHKTSYGH